jgi:ribonuclease D
MLLGGRAHSARCANPAICAICALQLAPHERRCLAELLSAAAERGLAPDQQRQLDCGLGPHLAAHLAALSAVVETPPPWAQGSFAPHMAAGGTVFARSAAPAGRPQGAFEDRADNSILAAKQRAETLVAASPHIAWTAARAAWGRDAMPWSAGPPATGPPRPQDVDLELVTTAAGVERLLQRLADVPAFAMDIEQYQAHSHYGHACVLQFATRKHGNFLVDACAPGVRAALRAGGALNRATSGAAIKLVHGSREDVGWLQRDFDAFFCNLLDTQDLAAMLNLPESLTTSGRTGKPGLLETVLGVMPEDCAQFDWTTRPLPLQQAYYAVSDAHYLLPLVAELWEKLCSKPDPEGLVLQLQERSEARAKQPYVPRVPSETPGTDPWQKDHNFKAALKGACPDRSPALHRRLVELYFWRDSVSRQLDEGVKWVLHKRDLCKMAKHFAETNASWTVDNMRACCQALDPPVVLHPQVLACAPPLERSVPAPAARPRPPRRPRPTTAQLTAVDGDGGYKRAWVILIDAEKRVAVLRDAEAQRRLGRGHTKNTWASIGGRVADEDGGVGWRTAVRTARLRAGLDLTDTTLFRPLLEHYSESTMFYLVVVRQPVELQPNIAEEIHDFAWLPWADLYRRGLDSPADFTLRTGVNAFHEDVRSIGSPADRYSIRQIFNSPPDPGPIPQHSRQFTVADVGPERYEGVVVEWNAGRRIGVVRKHDSYIELPCTARDLLEGNELVVLQDVRFQIATKPDRWGEGGQKKFAVNISGPGVQQCEHHPPGFGPDWWAEQLRDVADAWEIIPTDVAYPEKQIRRAFNSSDNGRLAFLGDVAQEYFVRRQWSLLEFARGVCAVCTERLSLSGLPATAAASQTRCFFCLKKDYTTNKRQAELAYRWKPPLASSIGRSQRGGWICDPPTDVHKLATGVEALLAVVSCEVDLATAGRLYETEETRVEDCYPKPPDIDESDRRELLLILEEGFDSPEETLKELPFPSVALKWRGCAFLGEAITKLCVAKYHYQNCPHATEGNLHDLTNTAETQSVKRTWLERCTADAGISSWVDRLVEITGVEAAAAAADCWNAAIGALFLQMSPDGGHVDGEGHRGAEATWDMDGRIREYVLREPEPEPEPGPGLEPEPEPGPGLEPEPELVLPVDEGEEGEGSGGGVVVHLQPPQHGEHPPVGNAALAAVRCRCAGCGAVLCTSDSLLLLNGGDWPPRLLLSSASTLTTAASTDAKQIALGIGKAACRACGGKLGTAEAGEAKLLVRKKAKAKFFDADDQPLAATDWQKLYKRAVG